MKVKKLLLWLLAILVLVPSILLAVINIPPGRILFSSVATHLSGRTIDFRGHIYPQISWPPALHISGLTVSNPEGTRDTNMAEIGSMDIGASAKGLMHGKVHIGKLSLINSNIHLERDANGDGKHLGKAFLLRGTAAASCLSHYAQVCPVDTTLTVGHTSLNAQGSVNVTIASQTADIMLDIKGADAAELFPLFGIALPPTAPYHLEGHLTYDGAVWHFEDFSGTMGESDLQGKMLWDTAQNPPRLTATLLSKKLRFVDLGPLIGIAPKTRLSEQQKNLATRQEESPFIIPDVPLDISRLSSMNADVEFTGTQVISENLPLDNFYMKIALDDRLMKITPVRFGTASGNISADMVIDARQSPVNNQADIHFNHLTLAQLLQGVGRSLGDIETPEGEIGGTMTLSGHGKSLHEMLGHANGVSGLGMEGGSISNLLIKLMSLDIAKSLGFILTGDKPLAIRCVVAGFDIKDGMMNTDSFVIDTADTNITAEGSVNLDGETIALRFLPAPKDATLLSLRSPIDIEGTLKNPSVKLEKGPLAARGVIATGLAVLAPVAAIVAFVEPGMGEDSDCSALLKQLNTKTGKTAQTNEIPRNP